MPGLISKPRDCARMAARLEGMPENMATADAFTGRRVTDREGIEYGKVRHIHIDQETLAVTGVTVRQGFNREYYLSRDYIDRFSERTLFLSRPPVRTGIPVTDIDGRKVGRVKRLCKNPETDELESIEVGTGIGGSKMLSKSEIWGVGEKVILRMTRSEFRQAA